MDVVPIPAFSDNYIWALADESTATFDCVDPGDAKPVIGFAQDRQLTLRSILITHHHHDHIGGVSELKAHFPQCVIYGPKDTRISSISDYVEKDQKVLIGSHTFKVLSNPGHTSSHISYYEQTKKWLFCGDTLFSAGCGRVFDGTLEQLHQSLHLFKSLPTETLIFCAHEYTLQNLKFAQTVEPANVQITDYLNSLNKSPLSCSLPSRLEQELLINPFLRTDQKEVQLYALQHGAQSMDSLEVFRILRQQKNQFSAR